MKDQPVTDDSVHQVPANQDPADQGSPSHDSAKGSSADRESARRAEIERQIASDQSPVGIDAKKTHVIIIRALERIEERLDAIEEKVGRLEG